MRHGFVALVREHLNLRLAVLYDQKSTLAFKIEHQDPMQWNLSLFPYLHNAVSQLMQLPSLNECFC